jgi:hypothetical protein
VTVKKTENGQQFPASAYLVVPDPEQPSTWKLRVQETPGSVTPAQLGRAAAALGPGFRGNKVALSADERASALRKLRGLYRQHGGDSDLPSVLQQAMTVVATKRLRKNAKSLADGPVEGAAAESLATLKSEVSDDLAVLGEASIYLTGMAAMDNGTLSFEAVAQAVQQACQEYERQRQMTAMPGMPTSGECSVIATFPGSAVYCSAGGKCWQVSYRMEGTDAVLDGEPVEVTAEFEPVEGPEDEGEDAQEAREALDPEAAAALIESSAKLIEAMPAMGYKRTGKVNRDTGMIENTAIITSHSSNGGKGRRVYSDRALQQIAKMSEGLPAYANHVAPDLAFKPRDVREMIGKHTNVRFVKGADGVGRVMSDLHIAEHHQPWVFSLADRMGDVIGNSLVSRGTVKMEGDTEVVDDILQVRSADLVSDPASTRGLYESAGADTAAAFLAIDFDVFQHLAEAQHPAVASLTFPKTKWTTSTEAEQWAKVHGFQAEAVEDIGDSYRIPQRAADGSATRTICLTEAADHPVVAEVIQEDTVDITAIIAALKDKPDTQKLLAEHYGFVPKAEHTALQESHTKLTGERDGAVKERDTLKLKVDGFEAAEATRVKRAKLQEAIAAHDLGKKFTGNDKVITPLFVSTLETLSEADWSKHLDERFAMVSAAAPAPGERPRSSGKSEDLAEGRQDGQEPKLDGLHDRLAAAMGR